MHDTDLLIRNAVIADPDDDVFMPGSIVCHEGVIDQVLKGEPDPRGLEMRSIDARRMHVSPSFIDHHCHVARSCSDMGMSADAAAGPMGCTMLADAGSCGLSTLEAFASEAATCQTEIKAYLNVSSLGQVSDLNPEYPDPALFEPQRIADAFKRHPFLRGLKLRYDKKCTRGLGTEAIKGSACLARSIGVPLCVHFAGHESAIEDFIGCLGRGDILCHIYNAQGQSIVDGGHGVLDCVREARARGVIMDSADGYMNNSFKVIRAALEDGFRPDIISTDLTVYRAFSELVYGLPMVMSKYLALGIPLSEVIRDVTANPAAAMGLERCGTLREGDPANFCIFTLDDASYDFRDHEGETIHARKLLVPQAVIARGNFRYSTPAFWAK